MQISRRVFLETTRSIAFASTFTTRASAEDSWQKIRAVAFDAFPILDPRPIFAACDRLFPGRGPEFAQHWRDRQFEYQWLRVAAGRYQDFWRVTEDALQHAALTLKVDMSQSQRDELMNEYLKLKCWPEVPQALRALRASGRKLAFLSNATPQILMAGLKNSGLESSLDEVISTERVKTYKPDPRAYELGTQVLKLQKHEILFVAFAGWDVAGAKWFGYPVFWNNRTGAEVERLGQAPDAIGSSLDALAQLLA
ncbi:MAG: haloacid dehalogenase type II [Povalibacter sp.]